MREIPVLAIPNQKISVLLDDLFYDITIKEASGIMAATVERQGTFLIANARIVAGWPILPYTYLENGNFVITTVNDEYPYYTQFGVTQFMFYASPAELEVIRASP